MGVEVGEVPVSTDVVPVDVGGYGGDGSVGEFAYFIVNITDTQPGVDKQGAVCAN